MTTPSSGSTDPLSASTDPLSASTDPSSRSTEPVPPGAAQPEPSDQQRLERARRADRATRGALAAVLGLEAVVTLLVPRALAFTDGGLGVARTVLLVVLAALMVLAAGLTRRTWGIGVGSALQVLFVCIGIWLFAMLIVGAIFVSVWWRLLVLRRDLVGTNGGWRILYS